MADIGNNHADIAVKRHEEEIQQLFDIANEQEDKLHAMAVKLAKLTGEAPPPPLPARESEEDRAAREKEAAKTARLAELRAEMAALEAPAVKPATAPTTFASELEARRALLPR